MHDLHIAQSVLTGRCRPAAARLLRPPLVSALTVHASAAAGPCMTSCASMSPAGGVAVPLRAAEPKWAWFSLREQARGNVHTRLPAGSALAGMGGRACLAVATRDTALGRACPRVV